MVKTPVDEKYLEFFENCPTRYIYIPTVRSMEQVHKVLSYKNINCVGVEAIVSTEDSELFAQENIDWKRNNCLFVWINAITLCDMKESQL